MAEQRPHILYSKELIRIGYGYPFWYPEPDSSAPAEFMNKGVQPGDVGILNNAGGFNFLFSIFKAAGDPINNGRVPPDFDPLPPQPIQHYPAAYGTVINSQHAVYRKNSAGVSTEALSSIMGAAPAVSFDFSTTEASGAVLCLPNSATKYDIRNKASIKRYAQKHALSWYNYINDPHSLGEEAPRGTLYVVTGCDKAITWGNAVVGRAAGSSAFSLKCTLGGIGGVDATVAKSWTVSSGVVPRLYPSPLAKYPYQQGLENQCIFTRGYTVSISKRPFSKSGWNVVLQHIGGSSKDRIPSFDTDEAPLPQSDRNTGVWTRISSFFDSKTVPKDPDLDHRRILAECTDHESLAAEAPEFPTAENELLNPSAATNEDLLSKDPSLEVAITPNEEWMEALQQYENDMKLTEEVLWSKLKDSLDANISKLSSPAGAPVTRSQEAVLARDRDTSSQASFIQKEPHQKHWVHRSTEARLSHEGNMSYLSDTESQPVSEDRRKAAHRVDATRLWAVLIGIDAYPSSSGCSPLHGCVNDVEKMVKFLVKDLGMSEGHIQRLLSTSSEERLMTRITVTRPTRKNIIDTLLSLSTRCDILPGDNIIIYFAGHGSWYDLSDLYGAGNISAEGSIEAICPIDRNTSSRTNPSVSNNCTTPSGTETRIPDISDREINTILTEIARKKGHNITVILDCCYSAGNAKGPREVVRRATSLPPTSIEDMLQAAHTRLRDLPKYHSVFDGAWTPNMSCHVLLAACQYFEPAKEERGDGSLSRCNGIFTRALIEALKSDSLKEGSTYADLICGLKMNTAQTPVVAGNATARLWYQPEVNKNASSSPSMLAWLLSGVGIGVVSESIA